ncbi:hypothetical protein [Xenorhabdus sp. TH1]|uniref:hypothetical protein n=1 Tax=Xenorhabdus sp. TH1 TaxID=3130166 RepID=UPI0030D35018
MANSTFAFISCSGVIVAQDLDSCEAGTVLSSTLKQKAIILPVTCSAPNSKRAMEIYKEKVEGNSEILELMGRKESTHVS